jgi:signal peptidase II
LQLNLTYNTGAAFSQGEGLGPYIGIAAAAVAIGLLWSGRTVPTRTGAVAVGLVLGGAAGNLADRAFRAGDGFLGGAVIDFVDVQWYPVFNVADMAVVGGALLLLFATARYHETEFDDGEAEDPVPVDETEFDDGEAEDPVPVDETEFDDGEAEDPVPVDETANGA